MNELRLESGLEDLAKYCICYKEKCFNHLRTCHEAFQDIQKVPEGFRQDLPRQSPASDLTLALASFESVLLHMSK